MAQSVVGALRVNLSLNSAQFQAGLKKARTGLASFGRAVKAGLVAAAAAATAALAGVANGVRNTLKEMDDLAKTARQIGVPVEALSELRLAAELTGQEFSSLTNGIGKLSKSMSDSLRSATGEQALAFRALGISVRDASGGLRAPLEVMDDIADRFSRMEDGAGKVALAMSIFGRAGRNMIPMLNEGSAGIRAMRDEANELGLTLDSKTAAAAEKFNDTLSRIRAVFSGMIQRITAGLLPALQSLATWMLNVTKGSNAFELAGKALGFTLRVMATGVTVLIAQFKALVLWVGALGQAMRQVFSGEFKEALNTLGTAVEGTKDLISNSVNQISTIWSNEAEKAAAAAPMLSDKLAAPVMLADKKVKSSTKKIKQTLTEAQKFMRNLAGVFHQAGAGLFDDLIQGTFDLRRSLKDLLSDLGSLLANNLMRQLLGGLLGSSAGFGSSPGSLSGFLGSFLPGFANGGSFKVGGTGGIDSQLVAFKASPDENVEITKPGQRSSSAGSDVDVIVINESNGAATVQRGESGTGSNGRQFQKLYVRDAVHEAMPSGLRKQKGFALNPVITKR
jgi:hypothetical protein